MSPCTASGRKRLSCVATSIADSEVLEQQRLERPRCRARTAPATAPGSRRARGRRRRCPGPTRTRTPRCARRRITLPSARYAVDPEPERVDLRPGRKLRAAPGRPRWRGRRRAGRAAAAGPARTSTEVTPGSGDAARGDDDVQVAVAVGVDALDVDDPPGDSPAVGRPRAAHRPVLPAWRPITLALGGRAAVPAVTATERGVHRARREDRRRPGEHQDEEQHAPHRAATNRSGGGPEAAALVVQDRRGQAAAVVADRGGRVEADPLPHGLAVQVDGEVGVDEQPLRPSRARGWRRCRSRRRRRRAERATAPRPRAAAGRSGTRPAPGRPR